ncbi:MAG: hypothetical protein IKH46_05395 [Lachnospiraceae bacterium]|nr:hypothetical protein [Lachnospiraceae bacterium]MBR6850657.1 hypothetical protein [Lachnospiraceae bacterium]
MDEKELYQFIAQIIASRNERNIQLSLGELYHILQREEASKEMLELVEHADKAVYELTDLAEKKKGKPVTKEELGKAIREGYESSRRRGC